MNSENDMQLSDYNLILHGNVAQQLQISRLFKSNMKILKKLKKERWRWKMERNTFQTLPI